MSTFSTMKSTRGSGIAMAPGTRCWMAPELVSMKSKQHTKESDVFSFGLVLHYLLTFGKHPFLTEGEERAHVIERNIEEMQIRIDNSLCPEALSFLGDLLIEDSLKRPQAKLLDQHPFLWSESKKIEFLKAVGDQPEAENPANHPNSLLEEDLQLTETGKYVSFASWNLEIERMYDEITQAWRFKKYRTDKLIDLIRFIRNVYSHRQDRSSHIKKTLKKKYFFESIRLLYLMFFP